MKELNRDQIIKALECCRYGGRCAECPCFEIPNCQALANENALALIKELTEENDRLREHCKPPIARNIDILKATTQADTVRKMQERLKALIKSDYINGTREQAMSAIDQIANELLTEDSK